MKIILFASIKDDFGSNKIDINDPELKFVKDLRNALKEKYDLNTENCMVAVNMEYVRDDFPINNNDEIAFIPPVSGGSSNDLVEIVNQPIDPESYSVSKSSSYGAELTFLGISRDHNDGKKVKELHYECFKEMALKEILKLIDESKDQYGVAYARVIHRIGEVKPGQISLIIIMGSTHRKESLDCMTDFLNKFKKKIPIWKKEIYDDDARWIES